MGKSKVKAAAENLQRWHNVGGTEIEAHRICALKEWPTIVKLAGKSTVIFNLIDLGDYFNVAVQAVAIAYKLPYVLGGTFLQQVSVDFVKPETTLGCVKCMLTNLKPEVVKELTPDKICAIKDLSFIPQNNNSVGQSNAYLAGMCAQMMVARYSTYMLQDPELEKISFQRLVFSVSTGESVRFEVLKQPVCPICGGAAKH
ncbi:MAG: hypothetical protein P4L67_01735 [Candidatus Pacebacteria bacterium]|nr:hypothetical protein [Candidatus Paceibacterota bacterium]